jgi:RimJ/RimL family protein N-acetyltransferase
MPIPKAMTTADSSAFPTLTTERLLLRQITPDDAEAIRAIFGSPEVLRFLNQPSVDTHEQAMELIDWLNGRYRDHHEPQWGISLPDKDRLIGTCGVYQWDHADRHIDIGFHIVPALWRNGYATEAARAIIGWCFERLDVHRIQADCTDGNIASERTLLKCGFTMEGIWRESCWEHNRFVDIKQFGLLRQEYAIGRTKPNG